MTGLQRVLDKAVRPWWGDHHPSAFTTKNADGYPVGVGILAHKEYATFNIWHYCMGGRPPLNVGLDLQQHFVMMFVIARRFGEQEVNKYPLSEWAMTLSPEAFADMVAKHSPIVTRFTGTYYTLSHGMFLPIHLSK